MIREPLNLALTVIALIPMTFFLFLSIYGLVNALSRFDLGKAPIYISMVFGVLGYVGLVMNLIQDKKLKAEVVNFIFLLLGIIGFMLFISLAGGLRVWKWVLFIEEPDEWAVIVGPILITIFLTVIKGKRLKKLYEREAEGLMG